MSRDIGAPMAFSHYDSRHYRTLDVEAGYTAWAPTYGDLEDRLDVDLLESSPALRHRSGEDRVADADVVDLGCGTGRTGAWARRRGAKTVTGVDLTAAMLELARARGAHDRLVKASVTATTLEGASADGVVSSLVLCHVADARAFFDEARRLLRPGGWLALVDYHPTFLYRGIPTHFTEGASGEERAVENHIHSFGAIFEASAKAGLELRDLRERFVDAEWVEARPKYARHLGMPVASGWVWDA
jgi:SAM-dependent methyltransferase